MYISFWFTGWNLFFFQCTYTRGRSGGMGECISIGGPTVALYTVQHATRFRGMVGEIIILFHVFFVKLLGTINIETKN